MSGQPPSGPGDDREAAIAFIQWSGRKLEALPTTVAMNVLATTVAATIASSFEPVGDERAIELHIEGVRLKLIRAREIQRDRDASQDAATGGHA